jgi:hypothetical protein
LVICIVIALSTRLRPVWKRQPTSSAAHCLKRVCAQRDGKRQVPAAHAKPQTKTVQRNQILSVEGLQPEGA